MGEAAGRRPTRRRQAGPRPHRHGGVVAGPGQPGGRRRGRGGTARAGVKGPAGGKVRTTAGSADVGTVDGTTYLKLPSTSAYAPVKPATLGTPDPATLFTPAIGITSLLTATTDATKGAQTRKGSEVLSTYTGHLPGARIADLLVIGDNNAVFDVCYGNTDSAQLSTVSLTCPFHPGPHAR